MIARAVRDSLRRELLARLLLTLGALLPYLPFLSFSVIHVTDDGFMSDIWNGELPGHVWAGEQLRAHGSLPHWASEVCSGFPIAGLEEPLGLLSFWTLPPAAALDALLLVWVLIAAHGTYSLARRLGSDRAGSVLAGVAFAASGYIVCQLKHLAIVGTVVWFPLGIVLLDHALARAATPEDATARAAAKRQLYLLGFGFVFAEQVLCAFPQSAYICALVYGVVALHRVLTNQPDPQQSLVSRLLPLLPATLVICVAAVIGTISLLPLSELGSVSDRGAGNGYDWAVLSHYWLPNAVMFLAPYFHGDVSDGSYTGHSIFWEDYAYVGAATFLLAFYGVARDFRNSRTRLYAGIMFFSYAAALGPATPVFRILFELLPGMKFFRFPTRFLVVVDLCLCVLGGVGLSLLARDLRTLLTRWKLARIVPVIVFGVVGGTVLDLSLHQPRQNPVVFADAWLEPPFTVKFLQTEPGKPRLYTPHHMEYHLAAFSAAHGWSDLRPYFAIRDLVQPNSNLYWGLATADCYAGIAPSWHEDVWGSHTRGSIVVAPTIRPMLREHRLDAKPSFLSLMRAYGVTHVISPFVVDALAPEVPLEAQPGREAKVYRVPNSSRVHVAEHAVISADTRAAVGIMTSDAFDPDRDVVLADAPPALVAASNANAAPPVIGRGHARIVHDEEEAVTVEADAPRGGFLVLADTFFPGWLAEVDGKPTPIYRANVSVRAVPLRAGTHQVRFLFRSAAVRRGRLIGGAAFAVLLGWLVLALLRFSRARRSA